jgi:hypothetical protein
MSTHKDKDESIEIVFEEEVPVWVFQQSRGDGKRVLLTIQLSTSSSNPQLLMSSATTSPSSYGSEEYGTIQDKKFVYTSSVLKSKTLRVRITDESNLFFLYSVSIGK